MLDGHLHGGGWRGWGGGGSSKKFYTRRLSPEDQPLTLLYIILSEKAPFRIPFIGIRYPFHIPTRHDGYLIQEVFLSFFYVALNKLTRYHHTLRLASLASPSSTTATLFSEGSRQLNPATKNEIHDKILHVFFCLFTLFFIAEYMTKRTQI